MVSRLSAGRSGRNRPADDFSRAFPLLTGAARRPPHPERRRPAVGDAVQSRGAADPQQPFGRPFIARAVIPLCKGHPGCYDSDVVKMFDHRLHRGDEAAVLGCWQGKPLGMSLTSVYHQRKVAISCELFPPKTAQGDESLLRNVAKLMVLQLRRPL